MRNPRVGEFQGKGKNSTCLVGLGRRGPVLSMGWGARDAAPHFREHPLAPLHCQ